MFTRPSIFPSLPLPATVLLAVLILVLSPLPTFGQTKKKSKPKLNPLSLPFTIQSDVKSLDLQGRRIALLGNVSLRRPDMAVFGDSLVAWLPSEEEQRKRKKLRRDQKKQGTKSNDGSSIPLNAVYGEGNIFLVKTPHFMMGRKIYYDFARDRGYLYDATIHIAPQQFEKLVPKDLRKYELVKVKKGKKKKRDDLKFPIYLRAKKILITGLVRGPRKFKADGARVTTNSYNRPPYQIKASHIEVEEYALDPKSSRKNHILQMDDVVFELRHTPFFYLPGMYWDTAWNPYFPSIRLGSSSKFGKFALLKFRFPEWIPTVKPELLLDFYEDRGAAQGTRIEYGPRKRWLKATSHFSGEMGDTPWWKIFHGEVEGYTLEDNGDEDRSTGLAPPKKRRYMMRWLHRQMLPGKIQFTGEYRRFSDNAFHREYFESDFKRGRDVENYLYFQRNHSSAGATLTGKVKQNEYLEQVEELPRMKWYLFGFPVLPFRNPLYLDLQGEAGYLRVLDSDRFSPTDELARFDQQAELAYPFQVGDFHFRPFFQSRFSAFSERQGDLSHIDRFTMAAGGSATIHIWRIFNVYLPSLGIVKLKHTIDPEIQYINIFHNTVGSGELIQIDDVDEVDRGSFFIFALRNQLFTRRNGETVKILDLFVRTTFFPKEKENDGDFFGDIEFEGLWNIAPLLKWEPFSLPLLKKASLAVAGDLRYDPYQGKIQEGNVGLSVVDPGRFRFTLSHRARRLTSEVLTLDMAAKLNEKWSVRAVYQYDFRDSRLVQQTYTVRRKIHEWYLSIEVDIDEGEDNTSVSFNLIPIFFAKPRQLFGYERQVVGERDERRLPGFE